jgi:hypothetical protein
MSKWTLWFLISAVVAFVTIGAKFLWLQSYTLDDEHKKKAILDWIIISKLETVNFDPKQIQSIQKVLPLKDFYSSNLKK